MRRIHKISSLIVLLLLAAALVMMLVGWLWLRSTLPVTNGNITLDNLQNDVEIVRDTYGVPHIFAPTWRDATIALGYLHAQDRLWQMELTRRVGAGRLAEVVGEPALKTDQLMRTLGLYQAASDSRAALSLPVQVALQAYADGVNAFIAAGDLPPEYRLAGFKPEPWQVADSLVWVKLMALTLGSGWRQELTAAALAEQLPPEALTTLMGWQEYKKKEKNPKENKPKDKPRTAEQSFDWQALLAALPPAPLGSATVPASASNAWAVAERRSSTGQPMLANDPHLMLASPVLWYLARIETPEGSLVGTTAPGLPFHVAGMNNDLAWGLTTTGADTSDLFIEKIGVVPELYVTPNGAEAFLTRTETIKVKGSADVLLKVRQTRHGPVIGDLVDSPLHNDKTTLSLQATYLRGDDTSAEALYWLGRAKTVSDLEMALRFVQAPVQNITFAERRGNIGMMTAGIIPVRAGGNGALPAPGDSALYDWVGIVPRHELPRVINPSSGAYGNANEAVVDKNYPHFITAAWDSGYRGQRLQQLLQQPQTITPQDMTAWQNDTLSLPDIELRDRLVMLLENQQLEAIHTDALKTVSVWNGHADADQIAPTIMTVWQEKLATALFADDVGEALLPRLRPISIHALLAALGDQKYDWCDDRRTTNSTETCTHAARVSLAATIAELQNKMGRDMANWQWQHFNIAPMANRFWDAIPVLRDLFDNSIATAGGQYTLLRAARTPSGASDELYSINHGAGYRALYDLSNPAASLFILATGQSGHVLSRYYSDQQKLWAAGKYTTLTGTLSELQKADGDYLTLQAPNDTAAE